MNQQKHQIKRQILELHIPAAEQGQRYHAILGDIQWRRILPLLERTCSALSEPDQIHRIESLQIDLADVDLHNLEADLMTKLSMALPDALARQIRLSQSAAKSADPGPKTTSLLELFSVFIRTGSLPWWVDSHQPLDFDDLLQKLIRDAPQRLIRLLPDLARDTETLKRLAIIHDDDSLSALCRLFVPSLDGSLHLQVRQLASGLHSSLDVAGTSIKRIKHTIWQGVLATVVLKPKLAADYPFLWKQALLKTALVLKVPYDVLVARAAQTMRPEQAGRFNHLADVIGSLHADSAARESANSSLIEALHRARVFQTLPDEVLNTLRLLIRYLPARLAQKLYDDLFSSRRQLTGDEQFQAILRMLHRTLDGESLPPLWVKQFLLKVQRSRPAPFAPAVLKEIEAVRQECIRREVAADKQQDQVIVDTRFSAAEEMFVENCGLVILWPFLGRFFENLGLIDDGQFKDQDAAHRAVGLLQYLVTEESDPPEYLLPLNKVLCGLAPTEVFDFGAPVTSAESEECVRLIEAVIVNAPILKNMSIDGFRNTFLRRKGILGTRDGMWLLRVERESFDIVLDRFPWEFGWVKLPWMDAPLRAEW